MNMNMPADPTVANLSVSDPDCVRAAEMCDAFYAAENASQAALPWADLFEYGHWTTYYYVVIVGLLFIIHIGRSMIDHKRKQRTTFTRTGTSMSRKVQAAGRFIFYRQLSNHRMALWLDLPKNVGSSAFILVTLIFLLGLAFAARPYYREHLGYGSPPIAIRTDAMAVACTPILIALAGKVNIITFFTGISHEKLNVVHRWAAWMTFGLSLIHAIPYFIASYRDYGWGGFDRVKHEFYAYGKTGANEYTGVPPLAILFALCVLSLPKIRERFYESFYAVHILLAVTYLGLMFWHAANLEDTWAYLWATVAIWLTSWLTRLFWKTQPLKIHHTWFRGAHAALTVCPEDVTRIDVWPEHDFRWTPGQHVFLRFTNIAPLHNHPFTISSASSTGKDVTRPHLVFLVRTHAGFTQKLASHMLKDHDKEGGISSVVWIDGPYGGLPYTIHNTYDSLLLLAGGTGITSVIPWLLDLVHRTANTSQRMRRVVLVWAMRNVNCLTWLEDDMSIVTAGISAELNIDIQIHVTGSISDRWSPTNPQIDHKEADDMSERNSSLVHYRVGRPVMRNILEEQVKVDEKTLVIGCGPRNFNVDLANAVASAQKRVMSGQCAEIALHTDHFGW